MMRVFARFVLMFIFIITNLKILDVNKNVKDQIDHCDQKNTNINNQKSTQYGNMLNCLLENHCQKYVEKC